MRLCLQGLTYSSFVGTTPPSYLLLSSYTGMCFKKTIFDSQSALALYQSMHLNYIYIYIYINMHYTLLVVEIYTQESRYKNSGALVQRK